MAPDMAGCVDLHLLSSISFTPFDTSLSFFEFCVGECYQTETSDRKKMGILPVLGPSFSSRADR